MIYSRSRSILNVFVHLTIGTNLCVNCSSECLSGDSIQIRDVDNKLYPIIETYLYLFRIYNSQIQPISINAEKL